MPVTHKNRVKMTVSGTPGTGTITLGSASSGYQSLATAYGADATVDVVITDGTDWEVARDCAYTHSGITLSRGTLEESSTGSALNLTSAAVVAVTSTAARTRTYGAAALGHVAGSDANTTMAVNTLYVVDMSAWATADRTYTLPTTAAVGDRIGVMVTSGNASYELLLTAATSDTLNGVAGGTEWSRVFLTGEVVIMRCVTADSAWVVEYDGRIPCVVFVRNDGTSTQSISATTNAKLQAALDDEVLDNASAWNNSTGTLTARRAGNYRVSSLGMLGSVIDGVSAVSSVWKNGSMYAAFNRVYASGSGQNIGSSGAAIIPLAVGDTLESYLYNSGASAYNSYAGATNIHFSVNEVF